MAKIRLLAALAALAGCGDDGARHIGDATSGSGDGAQPTAMLSHATLFRTDATGTNLGASGGHVNSGVWTTTAGAQNVPGNFVAHVFLSTLADPASADFAVLPIALAPGTNTFYFFADSDDLTGGTFGFGLNAWIDSDAVASPSASVFGAPSTTFGVDASTGCTAGFDGSCVTPAGSLAFVGAHGTVTLSAIAITSIGGAVTSGPCTDKVGADIHSATPIDTPNGTCDTTGSLTIVLN